MSRKKTKTRPHQVFRKPQPRPVYNALNDRTACYFVTTEWWVKDKTPEGEKQRWHKVSVNEVIDIPPAAYQLVMLSENRPGFAVTMVQEIPRRLFDWYNHANEQIQFQRRVRAEAQAEAASLERESAAEDLASEDPPATTSLDQSPAPLVSGEQEHAANG